MLYHNVQVMGHSLRVVDAAAVAGGALGVLWALAPGAEPAASVWVFGGLLGAYFAVLGERLHVYFARRTEDIGDELRALCEALAYAAGLACVTMEVFGFPLAGRRYLIALAGSAIALLGLRVLMRFTIRGLRRRGDDNRAWLIVGHNDRAADIAETILANPHFGIRIDEVVDIVDEPAQGERRGARAASGALAGLKTRVLSSAEEIRGILQTRVVDEVVITLPVRSYYDRICDIVRICNEAGISVKLRPELLNMGSVFTEVSHVGKIPMVTHFNGPSDYRMLVLKRIVDVIGAAGGLIVLSPLLLVLAVLVKLSSPGNVLFYQTRVGLHGRRFRMVKFRSMVQDASKMRERIAGFNERDGTAFKIQNDFRITPIGRIMRKYRLDELPQLWNVLVGDMSLVGPRPFPVDEAIGFEWWQRRRLSMPPGLTCFWQAADDPAMPIQQWMQLDMDYIDRWSLWLDMKLIWRTLATVARGRGW